MIDLDVNLNIHFELFPNFQNITFPNKCIIPYKSFFICYDQVAAIDIIQETCLGRSPDSF